MQANLIPFVLFVFAMSVTPGPGNLTHMALCSANGVRDVLGFWFGVVCGLFCLCMVVGMGLGGLLAEGGATVRALQYVALLYVVYLASKLVRMQLLDVAAQKKFSFVEGVPLHLVNPKAWAMAAVAYTQFYIPTESFSVQLLIFISVQVVLLGSAHLLWGVAGSSMHRVLGVGNRLRVFTVCSALLMVGATCYSMFLGG
ncbi:MAG: LysE family transporter [Desulfovibrionales bacterium]|nr:LysE family transporter [Desulfovibrionales bacterium]